MQPSMSSFTATGDDPGSVGRVFSAFKRVCARKPAFSAKAVAYLAELFGLALDAPLATATAADPIRVKTGLAPTNKIIWHEAFAHS